MLQDGLFSPQEQHTCPEFSVLAEGLKRSSQLRRANSSRHERSKCNAIIYCFHNEPKFTCTLACICIVYVQKIDKEHRVSTSPTDSVPRSILPTLPEAF